MASGPTENTIMGPCQPLGPMHSVTPPSPPTIDAPGEPRYKTQPNAMNFHVLTGKPIQKCTYDKSFQQMEIRRSCSPLSQKAFIQSHMSTAVFYQSIHRSD